MSLSNRRLQKSFNREKETPGEAARGPGLGYLFGLIKVKGLTKHPGVLTGDRTSGLHHGVKARLEETTKGVWMGAPPALPRAPAKPLRPASSHLALPKAHRPLPSLELTYYYPASPEASPRQHVKIVPLAPPGSLQRRSEEKLGLKTWVRGLEPQPRPTTCLPMWLQVNIQPLCTSVSSSVQWGGVRIT